MSWHEVLEVSPFASDADIKAAFRRLTATHHPDRGGDPALFRVVVKAYRDGLAADRTPPPPQRRPAVVAVEFAIEAMIEGLELKARRSESPIVRRAVEELRAEYERRRRR